jgi:hypothetical protein
MSRVTATTRASRCRTNQSAAGDQMARVFATAALLFEEIARDRLAPYSNKAGLRCLPKTRTPSPRLVREGVDAPVRAYVSSRTPPRVEFAGSIFELVSAFLSECHFTRQELISGWILLRSRKYGQPTPAIAVSDRSGMNLTFSPQRHGDQRGRWVKELQQ